MVYIVIRIAQTMESGKLREKKQQFAIPFYPIDAIGISYRYLYVVCVSSELFYYAHN